VSVTVITSHNAKGQGVKTGVRERLSVPEAAKALGISEGALRQRLHRGSIDSEKGEDGRVYVVITRDNNGDNVHNTAEEVPGPDEITELLRQHNEFLRRELEVWQEEARRKDHIIAALTERIPELEPASESPESPVSASEESGKGNVPPEQQEPSQPRSWVHRFFFGPG
jgi:hypothetical protein